MKRFDHRYCSYCKKKTLFEFIFCSDGAWTPYCTECYKAYDYEALFKRLKKTSI